MNNKMRKIATIMTLMLIITACGKKEVVTSSNEDTVKENNTKIQVDSGKSKEELDSIVYGDKEEQPTQEIIEPKNKKPADDVMTTETGEKQVEIKEAKDSRGEVSPDINDFWVNNKESVVENTIK